MSDTLKMTFESRSVNEGFARAAVAAFAARLDPNLEELSDIKTAVSEAVTNCIVHAYPDEVGLIHITVVTDAAAGVIRVSVRDSGVGIPDIAQARTAMFTTGGAERSGMGFTVMESFMDDVRVRSRPGKGTTVTLTRRITPRMGGR
ncbi:MAG: anti-sigma F factor [Clostridiaceae bacterium]|nr:anti-sigma F factor [Clostridiales bacterium]MDD6877139.1 anti-sigma F factor [Clostridiaceae bacterium]MDY3285637.1 anti-sigma F factor [Eubacteriales bacterium]MDY5015704.1 anti-sigma F factor [Eubacteriales bacterium]